MDYLKLCLDKWGNKYEYLSFSKSCGRMKVKYNCISHGERSQTFDSFIKNGCLVCYKTLSTDFFIEKSNLKHGRFYIYDNVVYITSRDEVEIICPNHGSFLQKPMYHLQGSGCYYCSHDVKTTDDFISKCSSIFNNKYDYSKVSYNGYNKKVEIICPSHGVLNIRIQIFLFQYLFF